MNLQTKIPLKPKTSNQLDYKSKVVLLGSCFSEHIGEKFSYFKFQTSINPFGILFHPLAIQNLVQHVIDKKYFSDADLYFHNEQWSCLEVHSKFNQTSKESLLGDLNSKINEAHSHLLNATHIIITLGTSWVYRHLASNSIVANCHKLSQNQFKKELLSVEEIVASLEATVSHVKRVNPNVTFIFTVSPVRHLKDGFVENTQSKAHLITAIHKFLNQESSTDKDQSFYFPSYEIMMDELRDYRFYTSDMLHPNELAVTYIWEKFKLVWLSKDALKLSEVVGSIQAKMNHRPFNPNSKAHQEFLAKLQSEIDELSLKHPRISF